MIAKSHRKRFGVLILLAFVRVDRRLDFRPDISQAERRRRLHRQIIDRGFAELRHRILNLDEAPCFATKKSR
jgi:hypothetical protein